MKIFDTATTKALEKYTIEHEPILSIDLIERAAKGVIEMMGSTPEETKGIRYIFCGVGNKGAIGLAMARILKEQGWSVQVYMIKFSNNISIDCGTNEKRLWDAGYEIKYLNKIDDFPTFEDEDEVVDAIIGTGITRGLTGLVANLVEYINISADMISCIDLPSGMHPDRPSDSGPIVEADIVFGLDLVKLCYLMPENEAYIDNWVLVDMDYLDEGRLILETNNHIFMPTDVGNFIIPSNKFAHKTQNGHGLLIAGSRGKTGASILSARAAMRAGIGLLTAAIPDRNYTSFQTAVPEAMCLVQGEVYVTRVPDELENYDGLAIGPGLGKTKETEKLVLDMIKRWKEPMIIDADALNILADNQKMKYKIPRYSILTPHIGEFDRLMGESTSHYERLDKMRAFSQEQEIIIILKGAHSAISLPNGDIFFNTSGNAGMATAGTGDVLTGILLGLISQGYSSLETAMIGVALHGVAGDLALEKQCIESMIASDIIENLGRAFKIMLMKDNPLADLLEGLDMDDEDDDDDD